MAKVQKTLRLEEDLLKELETEAKEMGINVQTYITLILNKRKKEA